MGIRNIKSAEDIPVNARDITFILKPFYTNVQINEALNAQNPYDIVPHQDTSGHGTFIASIAAGSEKDEFIGAAPGAELVVVKLKKADS